MSSSGGPPSLASGSGGAAPAEEVYRALFENSADPILITQPDGTTLRANAAACRLFGVSEAELRRDGRAGRVVTDDALRTFLADRERTGAATGELHFRRGDGTTLCLEASSSVIMQDGAERFAHVTFRDVTAARRAEQELRESREKLAAIHDRAPFAIVLSRLPDGAIVSVNDTFLELLELERGEVIGRTPVDLGMTDAACPVSLVARIERDGRVRDLDCECRTRTGRRRALLVNAEIVSLGGRAYLLETVQDVTARKRAVAALRESELKLRLLADAMPHIVCVLAPDGTALYVNQSWRTYSGLNLPQTRRIGWLGILQPDDVPAAIECRRRALRSRVPQDVELRYRGADGTYRWFLSRLAPVSEGDRVVRLVGAAMDIQDRKQAEEDLRAANARLADADRRKDEFLGVLSHELRSPLAPIRQSLFLLRHPARGDGAPLAVIERQVEHLTRLVDDLLDVTRIARGKVQLRRIGLDLRGVARRSADDLRGRMKERGVAFDVVLPAQPVWVRGDETRLAQIVSNLLHNASKFTRAGDRVSLTVDAGDGEARLQVRDTGAGIEPAMLGSVFDPFVQADRTRARTEGGLGLGLALVRGLVVLHGGSVRAESGGKGRGATFTVTLPLGAAAPAQAPPERAPGGAPTARRRVLVVDDNRDAADTLALLAAALGHDAEPAYDARSALEKVRERRPDVVLCDIGLPGIDGYEFARRVRASEGRGIRLVAVSGYARPEDVERAVEAGFDAHVAKPADPQRIATLLSAPPPDGRDPRPGESASA